MNRLLQLRQDLVSDRGFFQQHRQDTFDHQQLKAVVYGPNYEARDKTLAIIKENPGVFEHYHLTDATRDHQR